VRVRLIRREIWSAWVVLQPLADGAWSDPILNALSGDAGARNIFLQRIQRLCSHEDGPRIFPVNMCHDIVDEPKIFQLTGKHPHRSPFFYLPGKQIVFTHAFKKAGGSGKTPDGEKKFATKIHDDFVTAETAKQIEWDIGADEDG
jgi:hypothetical protein